MDTQHGEEQCQPADPANPWLNPILKNSIQHETDPKAHNVATISVRPMVLAASWRGAIERSDPAAPPLLHCPVSSFNWKPREAPRPRVQHPGVAPNRPTDPTESVICTKANPGGVQRLYNL